MPTIITQGAASAKALGFARAAGGGGTLQTVTFTSSGTWTAPAGVSNVSTIYGYGAAGTPASAGWAYASSGYFAYSLQSTANAGSPDNTPSYADLTGYADASLANVNSSTADRIITYFPVLYYYNPNTDGTTIYYDSPKSKRVRGLGSAIGGNWGNYSSALVKGTGSAWYFAIEQYFEEPATTGASATGLGLTFPGGDGGAPGTTTYTNVAVTPSTGYAISVPSGGSVTIQYYA